MIHKLCIKRNIVVIALSIFLISCNNSQSTGGQIEQVTLREETLPPVQPLKLEKVDLPEDYTMGESICIMYQDTILVVLKDGDPYPLKYMLTLVNMNTDEKIGEYFTYGQGPNELLSTLPRMHDNYLDIRCYTTSRLIAFNLDSAIMYGNDYKPDIMQHPNGNFGDWCSMDDTLFLTTNEWYFDGLRSCKENAKLPEFYWYSKSGKFKPDYNESDYKKVEFFASNVTGSSISINKKKNRVICCYRYQPYIKVFDLDMNLQRKICGPDKFDAEYIIENKFKCLFFDPEVGSNYDYSVATSDDENIFVLNQRSHRVLMNESRRETINGNSELFRLNWDGNVVARYSAKGKHLYFYNYCKNSNTMYLWVREDGEYSMYKAKLDEL